MLSFIGSNEFTLSNIIVASIVRVTTFEQLNPKDMTYTNVFPGTWTVTEASLGTTCTYLPTLRPFFRRFPFVSNNDSGSGTPANSESRKTQLSKLSSKPEIKRSSRNESAGGFTCLPEENMPSSFITSYSTTGPKNEEEVVPKATLKSQLIEQRYNNMERL
ncbi:hypothetical protein MMC22_006041 [Lobaria immixta]|nr:hypothetical protein [Lobaria immixta]